MTSSTTLERYEDRKYPPSQGPFKPAVWNLYRHYSETNNLWLEYDNFHSVDHNYQSFTPTTCHCYYLGDKTFFSAWWIVSFEFIFSSSVLCHILKRILTLWLFWIYITTTLQSADRQNQQLVRSIQERKNDCRWRSRDVIIASLLICVSYSYTHLCLPTHHLPREHLRWWAEEI